MLLYSKNLLPSTMGYLNTMQTIPSVPLYTFGTSFVPSDTEYWTVKGSYEFELKATQNNKNVMVVVPVTPGKIYKPSCDTNGDVHLFFTNSAKSTINIVYDTISGNKVAVAPPDAAYVCVYLTNRGLGAGVYYFRNWQLEEVHTLTSPATSFSPYELGMKKATLFTDNLIDMNPAKWEQGAFNSPGTPADNTNVIRYKEFIPVEPNTTYTVGIGTAVMGMHEMSNNQYGTRVKYTAIGYSEPYTFTTTDTTRYLLFNINTGDLNILNGLNLQIVKGVKLPPYKSYSLGMKPASLVPKKNLFNISELQESAWVVNALYKMYNLKPNTYYTMSTNCPLPDNRIANIYFNGNSTDSNGVYLGKPITAWSGATGQLYIAIPYNPDRQYTQDIIKGNYWIQLEEGSTATEPKPYELSMKPAILYPNKSILTRGWVPYRMFDGAFPSTSQTISENGSELTIESLGTPGMISQKVEVEPNTDYTLYFENEPGIIGSWYFYSSTGALIDFGPGTELRSINSGNNNFLYLGLFKPSVLNARQFIKFYKVTLVKGITDNPYGLGMKPL